MHLGSLFFLFHAEEFKKLIKKKNRYVICNQHLQKQEAAYRKILVIAEDDGSVRRNKYKEVGLINILRKILLQ